MGKRIDRTVKNVRWWVVLPILPAMMLVAGMKWLIDNAAEGCHSILTWAQKGASQ